MPTKFFISFRLLYRQLKDRPLLYSFYLLSAVACVLSFLLIYVNTIPYLRINSESNHSYRLYRLSYQSEQSNYSFIHDLVTDYDFESFQLYSSLQIENSTANITTFYSDNDFVSGLISSSGYMSLTELDDDSIIMGTFAPANEIINVGQEVRVADKDLYVVASWQDEAWLVNPDTFEEFFTYGDILFRSATVLDSIEQEELIGKFLSEDPTVSIQTPDEPISRAVSLTSVALLFMAVFYVLALLSYIQLISHMMSVIADDIRIYKIIGLSNRDSRVLVRLFITYLNTAVLSVAILLHHLLWEPFFSEMSYWGVQEFGLTDYGIVALVTLTVSLLIMIPYAQSWSRKSLAVSVVED